MGEATLSNGLHIVVIERHGFPAVAAHLTIDIRAVEDGDAGGRRAFFLGRVHISPLPGASSTAGCSVLGCAVAASGPADRLGDVVDRIAAVVLGAGVTRDLLARRLADAERALDVEQTGPGGTLSRNADALLFGLEHPYGPLPPRGPTPTLDDLATLRTNAVVPRASALVVAGDVTLQAVVTEAERALGAWGGEGVPTRSTSVLPALLGGPRIVAFHTSAVRQVMGAVVARGPAPADADAAAFEVLGQLLGAPFTSATFHRVREEMGAAYSVGAPIRWYPDASTITVVASFDRDKAIDGVAELLETIRGMRDSEVAADAVEGARRTLVGAWRRAMSTDRGAVALVANTIELGLPWASSQEWVQRYATVTEADVLRVARKYLGVRALRIVLIGNPEFLVTAQALRFGVPVRVDAFGRPVR
jgi:predicted Zn-dependent peptidase